MILRGSDGKVWGEIKNSTYVSHRKRKEHLCIKYRAYGIQSDIFDILIENNVYYINIVEDNERTLRSKVITWKEKGIRDTLRKEDGEQIFLPVSEMRLWEDKKIKHLDNW